MKKTKLLYVKRQNFRTYFFFVFLITLISGLPVFFVKSSTQYVNDIARENQKDTPFIKAIKSQDIKKVKSFIKSGVDINEVYQHGYTALMIAVSTGNIEIVKLLVEAGADLESYDNNSNTPLMHAFFNGEKDGVVKFLLTKKVNIEVMNGQEYTPLILAALNNHCKSMQLLITAGAKIEQKGRLDRTPLMYAIENGCVDAFRLLLKNKANIETRDVFTFTPLLLSVFNNNGVMIRILLQAKADRNASTINTISVGKKKHSFSSDVTIWAGEKDFLNDFFTTAMPPIPKGSKALDIAKQFECRLAENVLNNN